MGGTKSASNGTPALPNGHTNPTGSRSSRSRKRSRKTYTGWLFDKGAKVMVWYALITVLFRCPSSETDFTNDTPQLCKPYLKVHDLVAPSVQPYYDHYAAPYIQRVQPHVDQFKSRVYQPGFALYQQHGAPRLQQAQQFGQEQWNKILKPQFEMARESAGKQFDTVLGPHVKKAQEAVNPYYDSVKTSVNDIWELEVEPLYRHSAPYLDKFYRHGHDFAVQTALPHARYVSGAAWAFWIKQIWPHLRVVYGENVEPQLMRITERLSRYRDAKNLEADISSKAAVSATGVAAKSNESSIAASIVSYASSVVNSASSAASPTSTLTILEQFEDDLRSWESVCSTAVEEGAAHLEDHISEITVKMVTSQVEGTGRALVTSLDNTVDGVLDRVKASILATVAKLPEDADDKSIEVAHQAILDAVRGAGKSVKESAQAVRTWRKKFNAELDSLVEKAYESTMETVDNVRELRLSDIGRRYADRGLPHKEWSKYNDLKKATQKWRDGVSTVTVDNTDLTKAQAAAEDVENDAMATAERVATELGRLRDVGKWKATAGDATDDFETKTLPASAERARKRAAQKLSEASEAVIGNAASSVSEAILGTQQPAAESIMSRASESAESLVAVASEAVIGSQQPLGESILSKASKSAENVVGAASEAVLGSQQPLGESVLSQVSKSAESVVSAASNIAVSNVADGKKVAEKAQKSASSAAQGVSKSAADLSSTLSSSLASAASDVSAAVIGTESQLSDYATDAASKASEAIYGTESVLSDTATDIASSISRSVDSASSYLSSVVDDTKSVTSLVSKASSAISSAVSSASSQASEAASSVAAQAEQLKEQANKRVLGGAMAQVIVEAREPILDDDIVDAAEEQYASYSEKVRSIIAAAGDRANELTSAVLEAFSATKTGQGSVASATSIASEQYESALSAASSILLGSRDPVNSGSAAARQYYSDAVTAASQAIYGKPTAIVLASAASARFDQAKSLALEQFELVKSRISVQASGTPKPVHEQMFSSVESAYSLAVASANVQLQNVLGAVPTQNPFAASQGFYESISSVASSRLSDGLAAASNGYERAKIAVGAEPTPVHEAYLASAKRSYYEGVGAAYDQYSSYLEAASSAVGVAPTTGYRAYLAAAENTYSAAVAAASSNMQDLIKSASSLAGSKTKTPAESILSSISSQYDVAYTAASSQFAAASSQASVAVFGQEKGTAEKVSDAAAEAYSAAASRVSAAVYGTETPWTEAMARQAADNWNSLLTQASLRIYSTPTPFTESLLSQAGSYAAQATQAAASQYELVQSLFQEIVLGKDPDFTDSVYSRLQSVYFTNVPAFASSASSYVSAAYETASSAVNAVFTPPPQLNTLLAQVNDQLDSAVQAASQQIYGSSSGTFASFTDAAGSAYSDASASVSKAVYGEAPGYVDVASATLAQVGASATRAISEALFGRPTGAVEAAASSAQSVYSSAASVASEQAAAVSAAVSRALYGEEKTYAEKLEAQIAEAVASAQARILEFQADAQKFAASSFTAASEAVVEAASSASSAVSAASSYVRDEL